MEFWERQKSVGELYEQMSKPIKSRYNLKQMELDILLFLYNNPQYNRASDIVRIRHLTKSHVSASIKHLEEIEYLTCSYLDKKSLNLQISEKAMPCILEGKKMQEAYMQILFKDFSIEEVQMYKRLFQKTCENAEKEIKK
ncbi:MAG: MarR family transcriptional regulator [Firmicutes bacterium]|nr:MarR family transcriptional regulator [Bacillota bacterium]